MQNRTFKIEVYKRKFLEHCMFNDNYKTKAIQLIRFLLSNMIYDHAKRIAVCIYNQEELHKASGVSRVTISKVIPMLVKEGLVDKESNAVYFNLSFKFGEEDESDI